MKNANLVSLTLAFWVGLAGGGCDHEGAPGAAAPKNVADWFTIKVGGQAVRLQLAVLPLEMERGLMGRRNLGRDEGMLFVYRSPQTMSFWMRNTPAPLQIGFFTQTGELAEIYPMYPFDETPIRSRSDRLQFALEMNQGWYGDRGVKPGAQLDRAALASALKERGFEARQFGLGN